MSTEELGAWVAPDVELPAEWTQVGLVQAGQWPDKPWSDLTLTSMWASANRRGLSCRDILEALRELFDEGGEWARFAPQPALVLERAQAIVIRNRPALPEPARDERAELDEIMAAWQCWADQQPPARQEELRAFMAQVQAAPLEERHTLLRDQVAGALPGGPGRGAGDRQARQEEAARAYAEQAATAPISAGVLAELEGFVREGLEAQVPERYRHLVAAIRARVKPPVAKPQRRRRAS